MTKKKDKGQKPAEVQEELTLEEALDLPAAEDTVAAEVEPELEEGDYLPEAEATEEVVEEAAEEETAETEEQVEETAPEAPAKEESKGELVLDDTGAPLFKRLAPTRPDNGVTKKERMKPSYKAVTKQTAHEIGTNAALLSFPTDRFGITKDIKKALTSAASRIAGDDSKLALVQEVLDILSKHIVAKHKADKAYRAKLAAKNADAE